MRKTTLAGLGLAAIATAVVAVPALAGAARCEFGGPGKHGAERHHGRHHGPMFGGHMPSERMVQRMAEMLELSDEQRDRAFAAVDSARPGLRSLGLELRDNHRALHELQPGTPDYRERVAELAARQGELMERMIVAAAELHAELRAVLTPEQAARFDRWKEERAGRRGRGEGRSS